MAAKSMQRHQAGTTVARVAWYESMQAEHGPPPDVRPLHSVAGPSWLSSAGFGRSRAVCLTIPACRAEGDLSHDCPLQSFFRRVAAV
ncbi:hypothetical protein CAI18_09695 [Xanthomonas citri pv. punicae]|nr:hypothetical protein CAI14_11490 [Xanthomonas citri pv. punicae]QCZ68824.1 hypothetical protein CAI17_09120 [Xanthomonas citri pv. punicae]QCZ75057.1 hypothetical protein CAB38_22915 [Xanthomonas citri pv. punicae]QCZ76720.1 hypothetical protein XapA_07665 [Xanthomonas citri pv. punicae]QCZ81388.1 hypothetical protein XapB_11135 [Xanthomonas citri pv. punicae]